MLSFKNCGRVGDPVPLAAWQHRAISSSIDVPSATTIADAVLHVDRWPLPRLASWNARSLFHQGTAIDSKFSVLAGLLRCADVICLQETHALSQDDFALLGVLPRFTVYASSCGSHQSGGVAILVRSTLLISCEVIPHDIVPGRVLGIDWIYNGQARFVVCAHLSPSEDQSWQFLATTTSHFIEERRNCIGFLLGDFNVCTSPEDVLHSVTLQPLGVPGFRARHFKACFGHLSEIIFGPTRAGNDNLISALDRILSTILPELLDVFEVHAKLWGQPWAPPGDSDHCPISVTFGARTSMDAFPRWTVSTPQWPVIFEHQIAEHVDCSAHWSQRYVQVKDCMAATAAEIRDLSTVSAQSSPAARLSSGLRALHACLRGDVCLAQQLALIAGIPVTSRSPGQLLDRLALHLHKLREQDWHEQLRVAHAESVQAPWMHPKATVLSKLFALWKQGRRVPDPCILNEMHEPMGSSSEEAASLVSCWAATFDVIDLQDDPDITDYLPFVQPIPWDQFSFSVHEAIDHIKGSPATRGGPDEMEYRMFQKNPSVLATMAVECYQEACVTGSLPPFVLQSNTVMIPKSSVQSVHPSDLRPLTLNNIIAKVVPGILSTKGFALAPSWCHVSQHGCGQGRSTATALGAAEGHLWCFNRRYPSTAALLCDVRAAFPSLRRSWLFAILRASGCPPALLNLFRAHLTASFTWLVWKGCTHSGFLIREGVKQGCPLSGLLFILALDPWLRRSCSLLPPSIHLSAYYDDLLFITTTYEELLFAFELLRRLELDAGLRLNFKKCVCVPLGFCDVDSWRNAFHRCIGDHSPPELFQIPVEPASRFLGYWVGRGEINLCLVAGEKLFHRIPVIKALGAGMAHHVALARSVAFSILHHTLSVMTPSAQLKVLWREVENSLAAGPRSWLGLATHRLRECFGWPCDLPHLQLLSAELSLRQLTRLTCDVDAMLDKIQETHLDPNSLLVDPAHSWFGGGALNTWRQARILGRELDLLKRQRVVASGSHRISLKFALKKVSASLRAHFLPCLNSVHHDLLCRLVKQYCGEPLAAPFLRASYVLLVCQALRGIARVSAQSSVALARIFFGGLLHRLVPEHHGNCPFLLLSHTGSLYSCAVRGCYRHSLCRGPGLQWLSQAQPAILFDLVASLRHVSGTRSHLNQIAAVAHAFVCVCHTVYHAKPGAFEVLSPVQVTFRQLRLARAVRRRLH